MLDKLKNTMGIIICEILQHLIGSVKLGMMADVMFLTPSYYDVGKMRLLTTMLAKCVCLCEVSHDAMRKFI